MWLKGVTIRHVVVAVGFIRVARNGKRPEGNTPDTLSNTREGVYLLHPIYPDSFGEQMGNAAQLALEICPFDSERPKHAS